MVVHFVDIGRIVAHHCLKFLFIFFFLTVKRPADAAENINFYPNTNTYYLAKTQNATLQNLYWFEVTVIIFLS
jgi:hypothetical protein